MTKLACQRVDLSIAGKAVCNGLDLEITPGQLWALMGPNGIGKTTLMKCLAGLLEPETGHVLLDDRPIGRAPRRDVARALGMLQQHTVYVFDASVLETALTGRHPHLGRWQREGDEDRQKALRAIRAVDLEGFEDRSVTGLSGGEARRLAFATLMVQEPEVLLLDEPTNHLDMQHQLRIMGHVAALIDSGMHCAMVALHDVNLAARYCSHVLMLEGDGNWQAGAAGELLQADNLERLYRCPVVSVQTPSGRRFLPGG
ncbi:MAG: ABC transporter ATP-binding protein [Lysobacterales bacterium]|jgi:iron complex transport system ATP-binding protein